MIGIRLASSSSPALPLWPERQAVAELFSGLVSVLVADRVVLRSGRGIRLLQPAQEPLYFLPPSALVQRYARPSDTVRIDDIGLAVHLSLASGGYVARDAAWYYPGPDPDLAIIAGMICVDPSRVSSLTLDGQRVYAGRQPGSWILQGAGLIHRQVGNG